MGYVVVIVILQVCFIAVVLSNIRLNRSHRALIDKKEELIVALEGELAAKNRLVASLEALVKTYENATGIKA